MVRLSLPAVLWTCAAAVSAQPVPAPAPAGEAPSVRDQRRAELRTALQPNRRADIVPEGEVIQVPVRHLSESERAEMRRQLRQMQGDGPRPKP